MKQRRESFSNDEFFLGQSTTTGVLVDFCCGGELDDDDEEDDSDSDTESEGGTRRESSKRLVSVREADSFISAGVQSRRNCVLVVFMIALMLIWGTISMHWPPLTSLYFLGRCRARALPSRAAAGDTRRARTLEPLFLSRAPPPSPAPPPHPRVTLTRRAVETMFTIGYGDIQSGRAVAHFTQRGAVGGNRHHVAEHRDPRDGGRRARESGAVSARQAHRRIRGGPHDQQNAGRARGSRQEVTHETAQSCRHVRHADARSDCGGAASATRAGAKRLALLPAPSRRALAPLGPLFMYGVSQAGYTMVELALILGIGTVAMHFIEDDWSLLVAIYWAVETTTTVGYGDVVPTCTAGRAFFIFYAVVSTIIFARVRAQTLLSSRLSSRAPLTN